MREGRTGRRAGWSRCATAQAGSSAERRSYPVGVTPGPEIQDHLDGRLGSVPEPSLQRQAGTDPGVVAQLLGFAEILELLQRLALIWRMRSRVTLNVRPTSSSVLGCSPPRP